MTVTVLIADDHPIVRQGMQHLLEREADFRVVGEAGDGVEALRLIEQLKPDILLIDMMMPNLNGLEVLKQVSLLSPDTQTIVLSMQSADVYVVEAIKAGAHGYILKDSGPREVIDAIRDVLKGNQYLSAKISEQLEGAFQRIKDLPSDSYETLTSREREVFQMVAEGRSSKDIGDTLAISSRTVEIHRSKLLTKLGLRNQADLIRYAIKRGILSGEE